MSSESYCPLVSIAVIAYKSSATIIETLDSIFAQTYKNIELIVSDDCSPDDTIEITQKWIDSHKDRFIRTEIVTTPNNKGVTANYNRAVAQCNGEWIKEVDGDDILLPYCIAHYIEYIQTHPHTYYLFGKVSVFGEDKKKVSQFQNIIFDYSFFSLSKELQYKWLITRSFQPIPSVTAFYQKKKIEELNILYDERIPMLEDWPRWIQCIEKDIEFHFTDKIVAKYRICEESICSGRNHSAKFNKSIYKLFFLYQFRPMCRIEGLKIAVRTFIAYKYAYFEGKNIFWKVIWKIWRCFEKDATNKLPQ